MKANGFDRDAIVRSLRTAGARCAFLHGSHVTGTARENPGIDIAAHLGGRDLAAAVRFRNLLVHEYARVDDQRVAGYLDHVAELEEFVASVAAWVDRQA